MWTKEAIRQYMQDRQTQRTAPPSPEEIRRQLGWFMVQGQKQTNER